MSKNSGCIASAGRFFPFFSDHVHCPLNEATAGWLEKKPPRRSPLPPLKLSSAALYICLKTTKLSKSQFIVKPSYLLYGDAGHKHARLSVRRQQANVTLSSTWNFWQISLGRTHLWRASLHTHSGRLHPTFCGSPFFYLFIFLQWPRSTNRWRSGALQANARSAPPVNLKSCFKIKFGSI